MINTNTLQKEHDSIIASAWEDHQIIQQPAEPQLEEPFKVTGVAQLLIHERQSTAGPVPRQEHDVAYAGLTQAQNEQHNAK